METDAEDLAVQVLVLLPQLLVFLQVGGGRGRTVSLGGWAPRKRPRGLNGSVITEPAT